MLYLWLVGWCIFQHAVCVVGVHTVTLQQGQRSPMTEYFFWPKKDAWEELKTSLETRPWISER